jgi:acetylornithine/succinyldiaminopimelate/putrescine aminotransferase
MSAEQCVMLLEKQGLLVVPFGGARIRAVTHLDVDDADIDEAVSIFERVFAKV